MLGLLQNLTDNVDRNAKAIVRMERILAEHPDDSSYWEPKLERKKLSKSKWAAWRDELKKLIEADDN